jgi:protein-S-isoprenylcysteine O-methyltransferase Ste14
MFEWWFVAPWIVFAAWWLWRSRGNADVTRRETRLSRLSYVALFAVGAALLSLGDRISPARLWPFSAPLAAAALALEWGGVAFAIWAREHLGRMWSGTVTIKEEHRLIRTGPYRYVRHPIYTGILFGVLGVALARGSLAGLLALPLFVLGFVRKMVLEERFMMAQFGDEYRAYRRETRALIPFIV